MNNNRESEPEAPLLLKTSLDLKDSRTRGPPSKQNLLSASLTKNTKGNAASSVESSSSSSSSSVTISEVDQEESVADTINSRRYQQPKAQYKTKYNATVAPNAYCSNFYRQYLWEEKKLQNHVERVVNAKPRVDCMLPPIDLYQVCKVHKMREKAARIKQRNQENQQMVKRLTLALTDRKGAIDCWNDTPLQRSARDSRRKQTKKLIDRENLHLLERIAAVSKMCHLDNPILKPKQRYNAKSSVSIGVVYSGDIFKTKLKAVAGKKKNNPIKLVLYRAETLNFSYYNLS